MLLLVVRYLTAKKIERVQNQNDEINEINQCGATIAYFVCWILYLKLTIDIFAF